MHDAEVADVDAPVAAEEPALWRAVRERTHLVDVGLLLAVPAVLVGVFALPVGLRESLVFDYGTPSLGTAFASSFVHLQWTHLAVNLAAYGLVVLPTYALSAASDEVRRFRVVFVSLVLACPVVLSYMSQVALGDGVGVGFSGVGMALYGYMPLALAAFVESEFDVGPSREVAPMFFFVGMTIISVLSYGAVVTTPVSVPVHGQPVTVTPVLAMVLSGLAVATLLAVLLFGLDGVDEPSRLRARLADAAGTPGYVELVVVALFLFVAFPFATFPLDPVYLGGVANLYVHLLGYALGFIGAFATTLVGRWLFGPSAWL